MVHVRRMLGDLSTFMETGQSSGLEIVDIKVRLGVRLPPVGKAIQGLLRTCGVKILMLVCGFAKLMSAKS